MRVYVCSFPEFGSLREGSYSSYSASRFRNQSSLDRRRLILKPVPSAIAAGGSYAWRNLREANETPSDSTEVTKQIYEPLGPVYVGVWSKWSDPTKFEKRAQASNGEIYSTNGKIVWIWFLFAGIAWFSISYRSFGPNESDLWDVRELKKRTFLVVESREERQLMYYAIIIFSSLQSGSWLLGDTGGWTMSHLFLHGCKNDCF